MTSKFAAFEDAAAFVAGNSSRIDSTTLLELYGLFKVATVGLCDEPQPGFFAFQARAKWDAWKRTVCTRDEALERYRLLADNVHDSLPHPANSTSPVTDSKHSATKAEEDNAGFEGVEDLDSDDSYEGKSEITGKGVSLMAREQEDVLRAGKVLGLSDWVRTGDLAAIECFLDNNPHVGVNDADEGSGNTALHWACDSGSLDVVRFLVSKNADVNARDGEGLTPLHYAALHERRDLYNLLLENGASEGIADHSGMLPKDM
ncbi:ankyrin repeat-containing domain protein [Chytriomyces sp. MP71]|nr:ankyrin repeat-containing domain protein [Chytriomyces sp. MP71]